MPKSSKPKLKRLPGATSGVREGANVRMVKLMRPICPNSKITLKKGPDGELTPVPLAAGEVNHQKGNRRGWWEDCAEAGHEPYYTKREWPVPRPKITINEDGEKIQDGIVYVLNEEIRPNVAQVAIGARYNSGKSASIAIERKGFRRLGDFGYEEVCQYRNCENPVTVDTSAGGYCSKVHAQLVAADLQGVALMNANFGYVGDPSKWVNKRQQQLREAGQGIE
jgi:hypothetical protein